MNSPFLCLNTHQNPTIKHIDGEIVLSRDGFNLSLQKFGPDAANLANAILDNKSMSTIEDWLLTLPIFRKSKVIGLMNTLFSNRIISLKFVDNVGNFLEIEGMHQNSRIIGKSHNRKISMNTIYTFTEKNNVYMESFANKTRLSSNNWSQFICRILEKLESFDFFCSDLDLTNHLDQFMQIYLLNETSDEDQVSENNKRYWPFHDRLMDKKSRSWGDNLVRSGSYRFLPDAPPTKMEEDPTNSIDYQSDWFANPPHSKRIGSTSLEISMNTLNQLFNRSFMSTMIEGQSSDYKYKSQKIHRPYPSAGGIYEIQFFLISRSSETRPYCLYQYNPSLATLNELESDESISDQIAAYVAQCWMSKSSPNYVLLLAGNYPQLSYKYENIAYRLMLLNAGCATLRFYDACKSMNIGCCSTGCGPSHLIKQILPKSIDLTPVIEIGFGRDQ